MGHSAGANHLATAVLLQEFIQSDPELRRSLKKWASLSATFDYIHSREQRKIAWSRYFGDFEKIGERCPTALVRALEDKYRGRSKEEVGQARELPELLCLHARRDHFGAVDP